MSFSQTIAAGLFTSPASAVPGVPTLAAPSSLNTSRNTSLPVTGLTFTENSTSVIQVQIAATQGTLTMSTITGLTFTTGDGTTDAELQFTGSGANVQAALNTLSFVPANNYVGSATLTFNTSPGGGLFNPDNGHFYQFVETGNDIGCLQAKADAAALAVGIWKLLRARSLHTLV